MTGQHSAGGGSGAAHRFAGIGVVEGSLLLGAALVPPALHGLVVTEGGARAAAMLVAAQLGLALLALRHDRGRWPLVLATSAGATVALAVAASPVAGLLLYAGAAHALIFGGLCGGFAASLWPGRVDLITAMARRLDADWSPSMEGYTRGVTIAWTAFFGAQVLVSLLLFLFAPRAVWSGFVNLLDLPLVAAMFMAEYFWRCRRFPDRAHIGPLRFISALRRGAGIGGGGRVPPGPAAPAAGGTA